jgi:cytochrome c oxidase assembly protein subunit 15
VIRATARPPPENKIILRRTMSGVSVDRARVAGSRATVRRLTLASLVANVVIVVTGGAVRLTGSGLGCPTWPRCTDESYVASPEMGVYGAIEFGNRVVSVVVGLIAVAVVLAVAYGRPRRDARRRALLPPAAGVLALVIVQGVIGGISVRVHLNPWVVAAHFLLSMVLLAVGYTLWRRAVDRPAATVPAPLRTLTRLLTAVSFLVLAAGTVVTGSGPHSGDADAGRTGLDPQTVSQLHADAVFLLLGLSVALWLALRAAAAPSHAVRAAGTLVLVELAQGVVGFVQYFTNLPVLAVGLHMLGACLVWLSTLAVLASVGGRPGPAAARATEPAIGPAAAPEEAEERPEVLTT